MKENCNYSSYKNKRVVIMGLGLFDGGVSVTKFFVKKGAQVLVTDLRKEIDLKESLEKLKDLPIEYRLGEHKEEDFLKADLVIVNPGVSSDSKYIKLIKENNIPIDTEINILLKNINSKTIGITGSNGKSTTTSLIAHILKTAGYKVWLGGNIGKSLLNNLDEIKKDDWVVLELSSFQLERMNISPNIAVITNFTPNHLDRHKTLENYAKAKQNIIKFQKKEDLAFFNSKYNEFKKNWSKLTQAKKLYFGIKEGDITIENSFIISTIGNKNSKYIKVFPIEDLPLKGKGYLENYLASIGVALTQKISLNYIKEAILSFKGLPHRLELVGIFNEIKIYNDSDATTPESTQVALETIPNPILILGGKDKGLDFNELSFQIAKKVKTLIVYDETGRIIKDKVGKINKNLPIIEVNSLEEAVKNAKKISIRKDNILFSPASSSLVRFRNFVERGEIFKRLIKKYFN